MLFDILLVISRPCISLKVFAVHSIAAYSIGAMQLHICIIYNASEVSVTFISASCRSSLLSYRISEQEATSRKYRFPNFLFSLDGRTMEYVDNPFAVYPCLHSFLWWKRKWFILTSDWIMGFLDCETHRKRKSSQMIKLLKLTSSLKESQWIHFFQVKYFITYHEFEKVLRKINQRINQTRLVLRLVKVLSQCSTSQKGEIDLVTKKLKENVMIWARTLNDLTNSIKGEVKSFHVDHMVWSPVLPPPWFIHVMLSY